MKGLITIAACDEAASLRGFLPRLLPEAARMNCDVLVVDDGSRDATAEVATSFGCRVIKNPGNHGIGYSLRQGYLVANRESYDFSVTMDADGQHDAALLAPVIQGLQDADAVIASRYHPDSERINVPLDRDFLNIAILAMIRAITGWKITDPLSGFWAMHRRLFTFALEHGEEQRYGIHLENLIQFWYLCEPRPIIAEVAHPAIYGNGDRPLLTRTYSASNLEARVERFGTHANQILAVIDRMKAVVGSERVDEEIRNRR